MSGMRWNSKQLGCGGQDFSYSLDIISFEVLDFLCLSFLMCGLTIIALVLHFHTLLV